MKPYEKLKSIRIEKGLTTYELSELTGIPQSTISKMENGKRKIETDSIQALAYAFIITIVFLLGFGYFFNGAEAGYFLMAVSINFTIIMCSYNILDKLEK